MSWGAAEMRSEVGAGVSVVAVAIKKHTFKTYFGGKSTSFADGFHMESGRESGGGIKEKFQVLATAWGQCTFSAMEGSVALVEEKPEFSFGRDAFESVRNPPNGAVM